MKKIILLTAVPLLLLGACNDSENSSNKEAEQANEQKFDKSDVERDADFAMEAASGGMMEVELGNLALTNGSAASVKDFGRGMVDDHSKANEELKSLAASKNISLPAVPDQDKQKMINDLKEKHGSDFDKAYMDLMVIDHKEDIDHFQKEADKGNDADLKAWAAGKVPTLQHHLQMAEGIQTELKNSK